MKTRKAFNILNKKKEAPEQEMDSNAKELTANDEYQAQSTSAFAGLNCERDNSISNTMTAFMERSSGNLVSELQEEQNLHMFTKADAMKNCQKWVETQANIVSDSESTGRRYPKRKRNQSLSLEEETSTFDNNNEIEEAESVVSSSNSGAKGKRKTKKLKDKQLDLKCEWKNCSYSTEDMECFVKHVSEHVPEVGVNQDEGMYLCLWESCDFETVDSKEITRHVNFHSYHTKIKCIGSNMIARLKLPPCSYDHIGRNFLPDLPDVFSCDWDDCERTFNNSQLYFYHVHAHTKGMPKGHFVVGGVHCKWRGCKAVFRTAYKLIDHIRSHTQEKVVGCPTCGGLFASKVKLFDHCKRQLPLELKGYQCSHCSKYYPSERLLRDHMRHHVNHYKCSFCDMTCTNPSSLACHIRYRHLNIKPFKCNFCDYMSKTQHDMNYHLNTHCSDALYDCEEEDCDFSCRSAYGLSKHYRNYHRNEDEPLYCCHICDERFHRGSSLTKHLFNRHSLRWPSGHSRFRYKQDEDGFYRLQTVRYESLEVTQEIMQSESGTTPQEVRGQYSIYQVSGRKDGVPVFHILEEEEEDDPDPQESHSKTPGKIIISFEEVDTDGNVIQRKEMETEEIPSLPPGDVKVIEAAPSIETS